MFVAELAAYLYPDGTSAPASPVTGFTVNVFQGWPQPEKLSSLVATGAGYISVYPMDTEKPLPLTLRDWQVASVAAATISASPEGQVVTLSGIVSPGQNVGILVDGEAYIVAAQVGSTLAGLASALATLISADVPATSSGASVTVPSATKLEARVGTTGTMIRPLRRQQKMFQLTAWASLHTQRDKLGRAIDQAIEPLSRAALADGSIGILHYRQSRQDDGMQKQGIFRRDVLYAVDYMTTQTTTGTTVLDAQATVVGGIDVNIST
ncbi:hypothetical protein ACCC93_08780 [Herbaspirillum frisingense]